MLYRAATEMSSLSSSTTVLPVAVIGCGRMGRLHARVYSQIPNVKLVGVYDARPEAAAATASEYGGVAFQSVEELLRQVRAVTIATPTTSHLALASQCLQQGVACLIEKPLAPDVAEARQIAELARKYNIPVQVGHIERFNPAVRAMSKLGIVPRFMEVVRISPLTFRSIDVGVVLDMMIHDIDIILNLARSAVKQVEAVGVSVLGEQEDICNARLTFENGCVANLTASRLALKTERKLRVFGSEAYVSIDYQKRQGIVVRQGPNMPAVQQAIAAMRRGERQDLSAVSQEGLVDVQELTIEDVEPLRAELDAFVEAVTNKSRPFVNADDGLAAVETAARIVQAIGKSAPPVMHRPI
jgi:predicted dehydrogenase